MTKWMNKNDKMLDDRQMNEQWTDTQIMDS